MLSSHVYQKNKEKKMTPAFSSAPGDNWLVSRGSRDIAPITRQGGNFRAIILRLLLPVASL